MYRSILVPLDRSSFAEQALPLAFGIARRGNVPLDLVEVHALYALEDPLAGRLHFDKNEDAEWKQQEQVYLDATAKWAAVASQLRITTAVLSGSVALPESVAASILERARAANVDLIVMTTHGRGVLGRLALGSVADELIRHARVPVLLMRPIENARGPFPEPVFDSILIPLDGSSLAEQILEPAVELARLMESRCTLMRVVDSLSQKPEAEAYLERVAGKMRKNGLEVRTRIVIALHVAEALLNEAAAEPCSLIAVATHGRGGLGRLLFGSVADQLVRTATSPVLVCRAT